MATKIEMVSAVKEYAKAHYTKGWDVVVECYSDSMIEAAIEGASTVMGALRKVSKLAKEYSDFRSEIQGA